MLDPTLRRVVAYVATAEQRYGSAITTGTMTNRHVDAAIAAGLVEFVGCVAALDEYGCREFPPRWRAGYRLSFAGRQALREIRG